jgi:hypothetical protein
MATGRGAEITRLVAVTDDRSSHEVTIYGPEAMLVGYLRARISLRSMFVH